MDWQEVVGWAVSILIICGMVFGLAYLGIHNDVSGGFTPDNNTWIGVVGIGLQKCIVSIETRGESQTLDHGTIECGLKGE